MSSRESSSSVREVLATTLSLVRAHAALLFGTALVCLLPGFVSAMIVEPLLTPWPSSFVHTRDDGAMPSVGAYRLYKVAKFVVSNALLTVAHAVGASVAVTAHRGAPISARGIGRRLRARIVPLSVLGVVMGIVMLIGVTCFVLPGVYFLVLFALAPAACVTEFAGPTTALERSRALTQGRRWHVGGVLLVLMIPRLLLFALAVAHAHRISDGADWMSFKELLIDLVRSRHGWGVALLVLVADLFYVLFGGVGFGVLYARCAKLPTVDMVRTTDVFA